METAFEFPGSVVVAGVVVCVFPWQQKKGLPSALSLSPILALSGVGGFGVRRSVWTRVPESREVCCRERSTNICNRINSPVDHL